MTRGGDHGLSDHLDRRGKPCQYCGAPSVQTFVVAPSPGKGQPDIRIGLCATHAREPEPPLPTRRKAAQGIDQLAMVEDDGRGGVRIARSSEGQR